MATDPFRHIERPALPWRRERLTECKLPADSYPTLTRDEAIALARKVGRTRFFMLACVTCAQAADRHSTWDESPTDCMARHVQHSSRYHKDEESARLDAELRALAALAEAHRDEFEAYVADLGQTTDLARERDARRRRGNDRFR